MPKAAIFFADGLEEIEGLTVVDMLRRANIPIEIVSMNGFYTITGAHQIRIQADVLFEEMEFSDIDLFILPGGMPGTNHLRAHKPLCNLLIKAAASGRYIAAICAAPSVLGYLHILKGRKATCYPGYESKLLEAQPQTLPVVVDGNIVTSRGMGTAIDFSLALIALLIDQKKADELKAAIIYQQ